MFNTQVAVDNTQNTNDVSIASAYCQNDELYAFINMPYDTASYENLSAVLVPDADAEEETKIQKLIDGNTEISYFFLIDLSKQNENKSDIVSELTNSFSSDEKNCNFTVATIGSDFEIVSANIKDTNELNEVVAAISYEEEKVNLCEGIIEAYDYIADFQREAGMLQNLVVISDGAAINGDDVNSTPEQPQENGDDVNNTSEQPQENGDDEAVSVPNDTEEMPFETTEELTEVSGDEPGDVPGDIPSIPEDTTENQPADEPGNPNDNNPGSDDSIPTVADVVKVIDESPDVLTHLVAISDISSEMEEAFAPAYGCTCVAVDTAAAANAGTEIVSFIDNLYFASFPYNTSEPRCHIQIKIVNSYGEDDETILGTASRDNVPVMELIANNDDVSSTEETDDGNDTTENDGTDNNDDKKTLSPKAKKIIIIFVIVAIIAGIIILAVILMAGGVVFNSSKKKKKKLNNEALDAAIIPSDNSNGGFDAFAGSETAKTVASNPAPILSTAIFEQADSVYNGPAIPFAYDVLFGECLSAQHELQLAKPIYIGRANICNIIFNDPDVADVHARIVINDNEIYLEDLNSPTGTYLQDMRIQNSNKLRSGDRISVGDCEIVIRF